MPLLLAVALVAPSAAAASSGQFSILQDDAVLPGRHGYDPDPAMAEAKALGGDMIRAVVTWDSVSPSPKSRRKPTGFDAGNPNSRGYDWGLYDALMARARRRGLKVFLTFSPPMPYWASQQPRRCPHRTAGNRALPKTCNYRPDPRLFGKFVQAVVRRYGTRGRAPHRGQVALYSIWNEPNLPDYLTPQSKRTRAGRVDMGAKIYRGLWYEGWKSVARYDPPMRGKVLFGETAAISSPMDTLFAALCLDNRGRPLRGAMRRLQGCARPRKLPIGGFAHHPYNEAAVGSVFSRTPSRAAIPMAYLRRLHRLMDTGARHRRIPGGRGIFLSEFGFQSRPPDRLGLSLGAQARAINEADRLFFADRRVKAVSQYELVDSFQLRNFNTGLRLRNGTKKPAWAAYKMPLVVTKLRRSLVEVWGQVRPAAGRASPVITASSSGGGRFEPIAQRATNSRGYFRLRIRRPNASSLRFRSRWKSPSGEMLQSRVARAGRPIRYYREK
jgi:hypothetical protein